MDGAAFADFLRPLSDRLKKTAPYSSSEISTHAEFLPACLPQPSEMTRSISLWGTRTRFPTRTARSCFAFINRLVVKVETASLFDASSTDCNRSCVSVISAPICLLPQPFD
jgi:hypothetical protein